MRRWLLLLTVIGLAVLVAPVLVEQTDGVCEAFELRLQHSLPARPGAAPGAPNAAITLPALMYIRHHLAPLPPVLACSAAWWQAALVPGTVPMLAGH